MKNYKLENYEDVADFEKEFISDLNNDFADLEVSSPYYTECEILEISKAANNKSDFKVSVSVKGGIKSFLFRAAINSGTLALDEAKKKLFDDYFTKFDKVMAEYDSKVAESLEVSFEKAKIKIEAWQEAKKRVLENKAAEKEKIKLANKISRANKKFDSEARKLVKIDYTPIEWLKENTVSIIATVPTHFEKTFISIFGDVPHNKVDSNRKTSGGYQMKWSPSFCLTVAKDAVIPVELKNYFRNNKISDTSFIANLILRYDFEFGKNK